MAQQQQAPKNQFMTTLMLFVCIFLGMQLFFPKNNANPDTRTADQMLASLHEMNAQLKDVSANALLPQYVKKLEDDRNKEKWTADQFEKRELEGVVLVADTKFKSALYRREDKTQAALVRKKLNDGWLLLQQKYNRDHLKDYWQDAVAVAPTQQRPATEIKPATLFDDMVAELSVQNKNDLVWGFVPGYKLIDFLVHVTGGSAGFSYWFAAFLLALCVRVLIYPWSKKQYRFGRQMMQLQPYVKEIQEKFKDKKTGKIPPDKQAQVSAESMALYKEYGINPLAGCGSAFIQFPFFMIVYACMQLYRFEFVHGQFFWINPTATKFLGMNLAPNLGQTDQLLIIVYGISMIASQLMMPISDPTQVRQQRLIGLGVSVMVTFFMFSNPLPSAFTLYWVFANFLATAQAVYSYKIPAPPLEKVQTVKGGVKPKPGLMERFQTLMEEQARLQQGGQPGSTGKSDSATKPSTNGSPKNGKPELPANPDFFGKTGSPRSKKKK